MRPPVLWYVAAAPHVSLCWTTARTLPCTAGCQRPTPQPGSIMQLAAMCSPCNRRNVPCFLLSAQHLPGKCSLPGQAALAAAHAVLCLCSALPERVCMNSTILDDVRGIMTPAEASLTWCRWLRSKLYTVLGHAQGSCLVPPVQGELLPAARVPPPGRHPPGPPRPGERVPAQADRLVSGVCPGTPVHFMSWSLPSLVTRCRRPSRARYSWARLWMLEQRPFLDKSVMFWWSAVGLSHLSGQACAYSQLTHDVISGKGPAADESAPQ